MKLCTIYDPGGIDALPEPKTTDLDSRARVYWTGDALLIHPDECPAPFSLRATAATDTALVVDACWPLLYAMLSLREDAVFTIYNRPGTLLFSVGADLVDCAPKTPCACLLAAPPPDLAQYLESEHAETV